MSESINMVMEHNHITSTSLRCKIINANAYSEKRIEGLFLKIKNAIENLEKDFACLKSWEFIKKMRIKKELERNKRWIKQLENATGENNEYYN